MNLSNLRAGYTRNFFLQNLALELSPHIQRYSPAQLEAYAQQGYEFWQDIETRLLAQYKEAGLRQFARQGAQMLGGTQLDPRTILERLLQELPDRYVAVLEKHPDWAVEQLRVIWSRFQEYSR